MNIAIISENRNDFLLWKKNNNLKGEGLELRDKFKIGDKLYLCVTSILDFHSYTIHEIIEAEHAKQNKNYEEIVQTIKMNMAH